MSTSATRDGTVEVVEQIDRVSLSAPGLFLAFSKDAGRWLSFRVDGEELINQRRSPEVPVDVRVDGEWIVDTHGCVYAGYESRAVGGRHELAIRLRARPLPTTMTQYADAVPPGISRACPAVRERDARQRRYLYEIWCVYVVTPLSREVRRRIGVRMNHAYDFCGERLGKFESYLFKTPGAVVGDVESCVVDMPGPIAPHIVLRPRLPHRDAVRTFMSRRTSPEFDMGVMTLSNPATGRCLVTWHETTKTVYINHVAGDGASLSLLTTEVFPDYLVATHSPHPQVTSHEHVTAVLDGGVDAGLAAYARYLAKAAPPYARRPAWVTDMVMLQIDAVHFGGFEGIRARLPGIAADGFNAIYLMPISEGGYAPYDYYQIQPACGTEAELKAMTAEAHRLGIRVLLDLVIEVRRRDSPLVKEHPEYFTRDDAGRILPHTLFENASTDYAVEGYRRQVCEYAAYAVREQGIDGFRVDCPQSKSPNWHPGSGHAPWETVQTGVRLVGEVNEAIKRENPEAILLTEVGGPLFFTVSDICHHLGFGYQLLKEPVKSSGYDAEDYKNHLADHQDILPPGALAVFYLRNHDTAWFYGFDGYSPEFFAYEAIHGLIRGIPLAFGGQTSPEGSVAGPDGRLPWDGPSAEQYAFYRKLYALRREHRVLIDGACHYRGVTTGCRQVFSVLRKGGKDVAVALVNVSGERRRVRLEIDAATLGLARGPLSLRDAWSGSPERVTMQKGAADLDLEPWQVMVLVS